MTDRVGDQPPALDPRVGLAAERTLLAWVRTGLALMGFGFVVAKFGLFMREMASIREPQPLPSSGLSVWIGGSLLILGVIVNVAAVVQHIRLLRRLERGEPYQATAWSLGVAVTLMLACLGVVMTAYLFLSTH